MADIQAFRGIRYDLSKVGSLSEVVAPPYDVIDSRQQADLYELNPYNIVRLILNDGQDLAGEQDVYGRAGEIFKEWRRGGVLKDENEGAVYVYHQTFTTEGQTFTRRGFMARLKLEPFGEGNIYPHEETHSKAKEDRFRLMSACQANLSQIFGIYPDEDNEAQEILEAAIRDRTPLTALDANQVKHEIWLVTNPEAIAAAAQIMGPKPVYIADGHHRYETACNIRNERRLKEDLPADHPVDYVLMMCVSMFDPGMLVLPTHRLFRGLPPIDSKTLILKLAGAFECEVKGQGIQLADDLWEEIVVEDRQGNLAFYCRQDDTWVMVKLTAKGQQQLREVAAGHSEQWCSLGVSVLHRLVMKELLGQKGLASPRYVHSVEEVRAGLENGDVSGRDATGQVGSGVPFELGCLVMPATVDHVKAISENGERMPAKSTYFYPKLLSGLVINPLD